MWVLLLCRPPYQSLGLSGLPESFDPRQFGTSIQPKQLASGFGDIVFKISWDLKRMAAVIAQAPVVGRSYPHVAAMWPR